MKLSTVNTLIEALQTDTPVNRVLISRSKRDAKISVIKNLCRERDIVIQFVPQEAIDRKAGKNNQGVYAELSPVSLYDIEQIIATPSQGLIVMLDGIHDAGNLGAIIRSAVAADVDGIVVSSRNSAPINDTVLKTSSGYLTRARLVLSKNLNHTIERLKKEDYWICATDMQGETIYYNYDFLYKTVIIMGNEHDGVSSSLKKKADFRLRIPHGNSVESLNVSTTTAIVLFEALRQKHTASPPNRTGR